MPASEFPLQLLLQVVVVLGVCRVFGAMAVRVGQPRVVAEMIAGVVLGPSLFGLVAPHLQDVLFPTASRSWLRTLGAIGVTLYMFLVGVEFQFELFRARARDALAVSITGIVVPFTIGCLLAATLLRVPGYFPDGVGARQAMLFLGASMAITAFPVLARIVEDRGIAGTALGTLALAAGAIDDVIAWCLLAVVMASFRREPAIAVSAIAGGTLYVTIVLSLGRRVLEPIGTWVAQSGRIRPGLLIGLLVLVWACGTVADRIGIHAVFGAFVLGLAMPRGQLATALGSRLAPIVAALLPLFFAFSGLNTRLDLLDDVGAWMLAIVVIACASIGKGGACWAAARWSGADATTAKAIGVLMNTRGMMELIILNIGLEAGLITPALFSIMVTMAIVTTLATTPIFRRIYAGMAPG